MPPENMDYIVDKHLYYRKNCTYWQEKIHAIMRQCMSKNVTVSLINDIIYLLRARHKKINACSREYIAQYERNRGCYGV